MMDFSRERRCGARSAVFASRGPPDGTRDQGELCGKISGLSSSCFSRRRP
jgi:hypothetical protein